MQREIRSLRRALASALALALVVAACAQTTRPVAKKKKKDAEPEIILQTEAHDEKVGAEAAEDVASQVGLIEDPVWTSFVQHIGRRLARHAPPTDFEYRFHVVDDDTPNAFALPGGYIYISRGLLILANSEDEVANVLGHEIVHVARRHASARQSLIRGLPPIFSIFAIGRIASYSREQERESDTLGQQLAAAAGYDPAAMARFLRGLEFTERLRLGFVRSEGYFDTHPATTERIANAAARARGLQSAPGGGILRDGNAYLRQLDGMVVGIGAAEGVVERGRFLHADLGFSMRFPDGWPVINTHSAVGATASDRRAQIVLELQGRGLDPRTACDEYMEDPDIDQLRVLREQPIKLGLLEGYRIEGRAPSPFGIVAVHITWFVRDGNVYRLTGLALGPNTRTGIFANVARSFRPLNPRERGSIRETRLRVVPALANEDLGTLSARMKNQWNLQETAVVNGLFADDELAPGQLVKIAVSQPYKRPAPR